MLNDFHNEQNLINTNFNRLFHKPIIAFVVSYSLFSIGIIILSGLY